MAIRQHLDYETYSEADIKKVGHIAYAMHPSTEILMVSWCGVDGVVKQWAIDESDKPPREFLDMLTNVDFEKWAHNASFEMAITYFVATRQWGVKIPNFKKWIRQWRCSMVQGMAMSLPGTLAEQGRILGTPIQKQEGGLALIKLFSFPRKPTKKNPATRVYHFDDETRFDQYKSYNRDDVAAEWANYRRTGGFPMPAHEWELWHIDQEINFRGMPIDLDLVDAALEVHEKVRDLLIAKMKRLTRLENPNSPAQLLPWLMDRGYEYDNLRKANVEKVLNSYKTPEGGGDYEDDVAQVLDLRLLVSRTSIRKYNALVHARSSGGRLRGVFQFNGAGRTWRWAGRRFQPQNLPRGIFKTAEQMATAIGLIKSRDVETLDALYDTVNIPDVLASVIRCAIRARPGKVMTVADLASIESVMLAWAANSEYMLDLFRDGRDIYKDFATHWLKVPYNEVTKAMRQLCKPPSLGCFTADTLVLTRRGYLPIVDIQISDELWDGEEWVRHTGVIYQGDKKVIRQFGVSATTDHRILTPTGWVPWGDLRGSSIRPAIGLANGLLSSSITNTGSAGAAAMFFSGSVQVTSINAKQAGVLAAPTVNLPSHALQLLGSGSDNLNMIDWLAAHTPREADATTLKIETTAVEVLSSGSTLSKMQSDTSLLWKDGETYQEISTASTTTDITNPETYGLPPSRQTATTDAPIDTFGTTELYTHTLSFTETLRPGMLIQGPSGVRQQLENLLKTSSQNKAIAEVPTFDVTNAGPRSRFTVLTDEGPVLAHNCGYLLGAVGLLAYADAMGVTLTRQEAKAAVKTYRTAYPDVPQFWEDLDHAARYCIETKQPVTVNGKFTFRMKGPCMLIDLPSGRSLCYIRPAIERRTITYEDIDTGETRRREVMAVTYEGKNQTTTKWERIATHAGKITENIVQAIARDVLAEGIRNVYNELPDLDMCLHVHDELGGETNPDPVLLDRLQELMGRAPAWGRDIPLGSAGFQNPFYMKD